MHEQFLKIKKPKLIIVEDAHYFGHITFLLKAKKLGIKTAEYQHGYIGFAHPAYNYHENIFENIKEYLPEYFLTHGNYWNEVSRTPSEKIPIGLVELVNKVKSTSIVEKKTKKILFISGGTVFQELNKLIESSLISLKELGFDILLRPHPSEAPAISDRYSNLIEKGVKIDIGNLYETFNTIEIIIGMEVSTVLFEAICFTKKIYLINTEYTKFYEPKNPFIEFDNAENLIKSIKENRLILNDLNYFWEMDWKDKYKDFIENTIGVEYDNNN